MKNRLYIQIVFTLMRLTLTQLFILAAFVSGSYATDGRAQDVLQQRVTFHSQKYTVETLLPLLEKQVTARFVFSAKLIQSDRKVSVHAEQQPLEKVLNDVLTPLDLSYRVSGKLIIITPSLKPAPAPADEKKEAPKATYKVSGRVVDAKGEALIGATVLLGYQNMGQVTNQSGTFTFANIPEGVYTLTVSSIGFITLRKEVAVGANDVQLTLVMQEDNLQLEQVIVTSSGSPKKKIESSVAVSTINAKQLSQRPPLNSTDMLKAIPGLSPEASGGDGPGSVRVRGLPGGGYVFMGVMEDGLPVLPTGFSSIPSADQYYKVDLTVKTVEAVRGGHAAILLANTPGALINVISNTGTDQLSGKVKLTRGLSQNATRLDFNVGGPLAPKVKFNVGGFYRADDGIRPPSYRANEGGQLKANLTYQFTPNSYIRVYGKYLNDKTSWLVPAYYSYNGSGLGEALPFFDLLTQTLATRDTQVSVKAPNGNTYNYDLSDGFHTKLLAGGVEFKHTTRNEWVIKNNLRYQQTNGSFNGTLVIAASAYRSDVNYYYQDGQQLNKPTGYYTGQSLSATTNADKQFSDNLDIAKQVKNHSLSFGAGIHTYDIDMLTIGAAFNTEIKDKPRVVLVNTNQGNGFSNVNISGYRKGITTTTSAWASDEINWDRWTVDLGLRLDRFHIKGQRLQNVAPYTNYTPFDESNTYGTMSLGLNYKINEQHALFSRATRTYSALTIGDYANFNFDPSTVRDRGVFMAEAGYKVNTAKFSLFSSLVYASLSNISSSMLIPDTKGSFITIPTFASSRNISAEIEASYTPKPNLNFRFVATFQNSKYTSYEVTAPSTARADLAGKPFVWSGNKAERIPDALLELSGTYTYKKMDFFASLRHIGKRWSSPSNVYQLGSYDELSVGIDYRATKAIGLRIWGDNLLNSRGLTEGNVRGDQFLQNGNFETGSLQIGRIILPRSFWASLTYSF
ncbi:TonB-dependent receptor domain-containing protein [Spirosoma terrae]|uniref:TonB-dependent receptor n=1 Tax=Spirosoma terrae TaxID=1968276 RepID=A0A6L9LE94_9BACT|nr:TonB-dependent receptor [Spirosoma terrae]NDU98866.1 TonB-dependent receptor [Spirosoma terrae]